MVRTEFPADAAFPVILRGIGFAGSAGLVVGGVVGTIEWPVVVTFFGALAGIVIGTVTGALDGLLLAQVARRARTAWPARAASGAVWLVSGLVVTSADDQFTAVTDRAAIIACCLGLGTACGPLIARGIAPLTWVRGRAAIRLPQLAAQLLLWGAVGGTVLGAIVGVIIGIRAYLPTAPFALIEGAILGGVSGIVLALSLGAVAVLPRLRSRR